MESKRPHLKSGDTIRVHIDRLSTGGRGVARHEGLVVFVPDTAPDEDVEVQLTFVKKNFAEAKLKTILHPSPFRVAPPCPVAGVCGGCSWQHVAYSEQLNQKREIVRDALRKFSGFDMSDPDFVREVVASPRTFRYRNRIQLHSDGKHLGFHRRGSHQIIDIADCMISEEALVDRFAEVRESFSNSRGRIELFSTESGEVAMRNASVPANTADDENSELAFSQVNTAQNQNLIDFVIEVLKNKLKVPPDSKIFDLYAGNGNFTFPIAKEFPRVEVASAELNSRSVKAAKDKARKDFSNRSLRIELRDVAEFLANENEAEASTIVLDPPRVGCTPEVMEEIRRLAPENIVYISCHPVTLARDLSKLGRETYQLLEVQPFDMFPQTDHVETVAVLKRR